MPHKNNPLVNVDVPPARARAPRFRTLRVLGVVFILLLLALGIWKAYELILVALGWYGEQRNVIHAVLVAIALLVFVSVVAVVVSRSRKRKSDYAPISTPPPAAQAHANDSAKPKVSATTDAPVSTPLHPTDPDAPRDPFRER